VPWIQYVTEMIQNEADFFSNPGAKVMSDCEKIIDMRQKDGTKRKDLLQLLIDARRTNLDVANFAMSDNYDETTIKNSTNKSVEKEQKGLTRTQILQNAYIVLAAGYDTTAVTLACAAFELTQRPDIQERLREELRQNSVSEDKDGHLDFEALQRLPYLDAFIKETLRYHSVAIHLSRQCTEDCEIKGIKFKKDDLITFPLSVIHFDEDSFENAHEFIPERFLENKYKPSAYQPFGQGPRNCIGMRFAQMEIKITLAKVLMKYKVEKDISTCSEIEWDNFLLIRRPNHPIMVNISAI